MKKLLTSLFNYSLFRHAQRLALVCALLSIATNAAAGGDSSWDASFTAEAKIAMSATAEGKVYVSEVATTPSDKNWVTDKDNSSKTEKWKSAKNNDKKTKTYYWYASAKENSNSTFVGWYENPELTGTPQKGNNKGTYWEFEKTESVSSSGDYPFTKYALFTKIIDIKETNIEWTKQTGEDTYGPIGVTLTNAAGFNWSIKYDGGDNTTSFNCSASSTTTETGDIELTLSAGNDVTNGMEYLIVLTANNGGYAEIKVKIISSINVTFSAPTAGGGSFVAKPTNIDGKTYDSSESAKKTVTLSDNKSFPHTLTATPETGYDFMRWVITDMNGNPYDFDSSTPNVDPITANPYNYSLKDGDNISAEFVKSNNYAQFQIKGVDNKYYYILEEAIKAAQTSESKTIVVYKSGTLYTAHKTLTNDKYEFIIPAGITLLVPGEATYKTATTLQKEHTVEVTPPDKVTPYKTLTLSPNTRIIGNGNICVYADVSFVFGYNGTPINPGMIVLGENSEIIMNNGSSLTAYGYIIGESSSQVVANDGAKIYELFQFRDWRGGTRMATVNSGKDTYRVFLFSQYYMQNIECKLILNYGSVAYVSSTGSTVNAFITTYQPLLTLVMISKATTSAEDKGIFCIGENTRVVRWYDEEKDRQMYVIQNAKSDSKGIAKFGVVSTNMQGVGTIDSRYFVLPFANNMDITLENVDVTSDYEFALLPGSKIMIDDNSSLTAKSRIFVYDKEYLRDPENNLGFSYYGGYNVPFKHVHYTANKSRTDIEAIRIEAEIDDAELVVNGVFNVVDGNVKVERTTLESGLYTTGGTTSDEKKFGANITSSGGGKVVFDVVGETIYTYQFQQGASSDLTNDTWASIPVTNARLRNGDGTWAAGHGAQGGQVYTYSESKERWVLPQEVSMLTSTGNEFLVSFPEPTNTKTQNLVISMQTEDELSLENFDITLPENDFFTKGVASYDKEKDQLIIPITYHLTNIHNLGNPNTQKLTVKCKDTNLGNDLDSKEYTLSAVEDYTPNFTVKIGENDVTTSKQYTFAPTQALDKLSKTVIIYPVEKNVATLAATQWVGEATESPVFTTKGTAPNDLSIVYTPQIKGEDQGTFTITATYIDAAHAPISKEIVINLKGTGTLRDNTLAFQQDLIDGYTIDQGLTYSDIFANIGNGNKVTFTCTYVGGDVDGQDASSLVTTSVTGDNYAIKVNEVASITEVRKVKIIASQTATSVMNKVDREIELTILPPAIWNWSDLYFGQTYNNPVTPSRNDAWTLTEIEDPHNMVGALQGDYTNYSVVVATGDLNTVYEAKFQFAQEGGNPKVFTSKIYSDPRVLGFCIDAAHKYKGITKSAIGGVSFDDTNDRISLNAGAQWVIQMIGMPDKMTFTTNGENLWNIEQRASESSAWSAVTTWTRLSNGEYTFSLLPTTRFVRITYGSTNPASVGQLSNVCVSKLSVKADVEELYLPIHKDGSTSSKTVVLTHTKATAPEISAITGLEYNYETTDNLGTIEEPYYQTILTIKVPSTFSQGTYTLTATQGTDVASISVYADYFPQGLPIKLATDDAKRYYFVVTASEYVSWDAASKEVVLKNPGGSVPRSVVLAFEGAPSRISFTASRDIDDKEWRIYESVDGTDDSFIESSLVNRDKETGATFTHNLHYTTRYVRIYYYSDNQAELRLSDLVIEGDPMLLVNPGELEFSNDDKDKPLTLTAINLKNILIELDNTTDFQMSHGEAAASASYTLSSADYPDALGLNKVGDIVINTQWITNSIVNDGMITIYNLDDDNAILAKVKLVGAGKYLHKEEAKATGLYTGIPDGTRDTDGDGNPNTDYIYTFHGSNYEDYTYHQVDLSNAFAADGTALFDLLFVYGETTTTDAAMNITAPAGEKGSNARTPYYVYVRDIDAYGNYDRYRFVTMVDNANVGDKTVISGIISSTTEESVEGETNHGSAEVKYINVTDKPLSVYITGFAPYATTGYTKGDEGVFFFRGKHGSKLDIYLEDAHIFARNKMKDGQPFYTRGDERNPTFTEGYARGSGGVLVFECLDVFEEIDKTASFEVSIHTIGNNLLKSNYGCFNFFFGMDPFQISAPIHVRLHSEDHLLSKTTLNFDDIWPTQLDAERKIANSKRTNGFLGLKKLNNNAPSIDLGNPYTTVNFNGGQVQLQNAQIVSTNYKTTLAISYRAGEYGGDKVGLRFAYGIGTDDVGGTVNFYDGTITVEPMWVKEEYKNYYFIDKDENGKEITKTVGTITDENDPTKKIDIYEYRTTCLRCPKNTNVYGGSICWLRACQHVTSKGGAPAGGGGVDVGQYIYKFNSDQGDKKDENTQLVTSIQFPANISIQNADGSTSTLESYFNVYYPKNAQDKGEYGLKSITPDENDQLYFWIPEGYGGVTAEKDKFLTTWKACMTEISAGMNGITGTVGGNTAVEKNEEIKYMLYCQIDQNISDVITAGEGEGDKKKYSYSAPVKVPAVAQAFYGSSYTSLSPTSVGDELQNEVVSAKPYEVTDKVYYITTATADVWQTFTAPFDVAKIWVVETYSEAELEKLAKSAKEAGKNARDEVMLAQAKHNADFAAFFGVAMAIGTSDPLETIFNDFKEWGKIQDSKTTDDKGNSITPLYAETGAYTLRDRYQLIPYNGSNWNKANFYLNHNAADWKIIGTNEYDDPICEVHWELPAVDNDGVPENGILMRKGHTYSMLLPYCTGCWNYDEQNKLVKRDFWDYWSGKFLIFESVDYSKESEQVHIIEGSEYLKEDWTEKELALSPSGIFVPDNLPADNYAKVTGNSTFAFMEPINPNLFVYYPSINSEGFFPEEDPIINPTTAFMLANLPENINGMPARGVKRSGEIIYDQLDDDNNGNQNGTSGHIPTVGGGNDLFVTSIAGGINVAVAAPQNVRVLSSTGAVIYSGYIQTAVDIKLPTNGIYIVSGENEVQKILY